MCIWKCGLCHRGSQAKVPCDANTNWFQFLNFFVMIYSWGRFSFEQFSWPSPLTDCSSSNLCSIKEPLLIGRRDGREIFRKLLKACFHVHICTFFCLLIFYLKLELIWHTFLFFILLHVFNLHIGFHLSFDWPFQVLIPNLKCQGTKIVTAATLDSMLVTCLQGPVLEI